jgi:hypothetical protein
MTTANTDRATDREILEHLVILKAAYPQSITDMDFKILVRRYTEEMRSYSARVVARATGQAWKAHTKHFPTLGQLVELLEIERRNDLTAQTGRTPRSRQLSEPRTTTTEEALSRIRGIIASITEDKEM